MTAKPGSLPRWASTGSADIVEPASAKKDIGWISGERPPAEFLNWILNTNYLWADFVDEFFTSAGTAEGPVSLRTPAESTTLPLAQWRDWEGGLRSHIDHNGYRMGQVQEWWEHWRTTGATAPDGWTSTGGGTLNVRDPKSGFPFRHAELECSAAETKDLIPNYVHYLSSSSLYVQEWEFETGTIDTGDSADIRTGVQHGHGGANDWFIYFFNDNDVSVNWRARVVNAAPTDVDTGVACNANTVYRFRIEILGTNMHSGGNFRFRFYINGVLVSTQTIATPGADVIRPYHRLESHGGAGTYLVNVGPHRIVFNHRDVQDAL